LDAALFVLFTSGFELEMNKNSFSIIVIFSICIIAAVGCGKKQPISNYTMTNQDAIAEFNQELFASANLNTERGDYLLGPGDLLEIKVLEAERLNAASRVSSRGYISVPLLDEVKVDGLTASEAEQYIEDQYAKTYIRDPHVSIFVKEHFSQRVTVIGQVKNPGTYDYPSRQKLLDAIALAGGLTEKASQSVQVRRLSSISHGTNQTVIVNLDELIKEGKTDLNISINGGDVIFVPEAGSFFVDGAIRRAGEYHIKQKISIEEAIITAGGYESFADTDKVLVMRVTEDGKREEFEIAMDKNLQSQTQFYVQDRDIVIVNASFWGKFFHGAGINLGLPGMGVSYRARE